MRWSAGLSVVASMFALLSAAVAQRSAPAVQILSGLEGRYYVAGAPRTSHTLAEQMRAYRIPARALR